MTAQLNVCSSCEDGNLVPGIYEYTFVEGGREIRVPDMEFMQCASCGADPVLAPQLKRNQLRIADARRKAMGLLTGAQIRAVRESLGLSQPQAAKLFGGGPNIFSKYERGENIQSIPMDRLLRLVADQPSLLHKLLVEPQVEPSVAPKAEARYTGAVQLSVRTSKNGTSRDNPIGASNGTGIWTDEIHFNTISSVPWDKAA